MCKRAGTPLRSCPSSFLWLLLLRAIQQESIAAKRLAAVCLECNAQRIIRIELYHDAGAGHSVRFRSCCSECVGSKIVKRHRSFEGIGEDADAFLCGVGIIQRDRDIGAAIARADAITSARAHDTAVNSDSAAALIIFAAADARTAGRMRNNLAGTFAVALGVNRERARRRHISVLRKQMTFPRFAPSNGALKMGFGQSVNGNSASRRPPPRLYEADNSSSIFCVHLVVTSR